MKEHLTRVESHSGSTSYVSPGVQNEFIHMMASTFHQSLLRSIHKAKYYGLMFDSTPDQAHREQMAEVVRYVEADFERKIVRVRESFLGFIQIRQKDAESLVEDILKQLEKALGKTPNAVPVVVKSQSKTRWSARTEAVKPVNKYLEEILQVLQDMVDNENETSETRSDARQLYNRMLSYHFLTLLGFWNKVLIRIDYIQKRLQDPSMNFHNVALDLKALRNHFDDEREVLVSESLEEGLGLCQEWNIEIERRQRRMADENSRDAGLTAKEEMERVMKGTLDCLHREIDESFARLHDTDAKFGFLLDVEGLCYGVDSNDLKKKCENFGELYSSDVDRQQLYEEILDCRMLLSSRANMKISRPEDILEFIVQYGDKSVFSNLNIAIQIMLTIAVSIASLYCVWQNSGNTVKIKFD
ncbi:uncharacterized protein LOC106478051 [Limulus polyphemus]|uniref:Uncharacterized protein LOC106478051 n=1 Tax=Limulus polyphemus TaxID=6850 RepID=A0ABM1S0X9_LIMPO|nr:uncharacterized protein LOC106478051 [Limulus polyphemus]